MDAFIALVKDLRTSQKRWFKFRKPSDLEDAKRLEREVDRALERELGPAREATLFDRMEAAEGSRP